MFKIQFYHEVCVYVSNHDIVDNNSPIVYVATIFFSRNVEPQSFVRGVTPL